MRIFGLDFTSAPSRWKPITCAVCELQNNILHVQNILSLTSFQDFEDFLSTGGPWLAALDFPFGQPRKLLENIAWPTNWEGYMRIIDSMDKKQFEEALKRYGESRPAGDKLHLRVTDVLAGARSPMMMHRVPVGKMFFEGATRLFRSNVSVLPCRPINANRIAVEGYPALVARGLIGKRSYKSDERGKQTNDREMARTGIIGDLCSETLVNCYGLHVELTDDMAEMLIKDAMGDKLDAVLCAVQAGWAFLQRDRGYGIPEECDRGEGWIVDPILPSQSAVLST
ncbi:MAG TPA: hypothetical protein VF043_35095 [Ktedonobacteraceae bacterium]